jgi:hypothetical protein
MTASAAYTVAARSGQTISRDADTIPHGRPRAAYAGYTPMNLLRDRSWAEAMSLLDAPVLLPMYRIPYAVVAIVAKTHVGPSRAPQAKSGQDHPLWPTKAMSMHATSVKPTLT